MRLKKIKKITNIAIKLFTLELNNIYFDTHAVNAVFEKKTSR